MRPIAARVVHISTEHVTIIGVVGVYPGGGDETNRSLSTARIGQVGYVSDVFTSAFLAEFRRVAVWILEGVAVAFPCVIQFDLSLVLAGSFGFGMFWSEFDMACLLRLWVDFLV